MLHKFAPAASQSEYFSPSYVREENRIIAWLAREPVDLIQALLTELNPPFFLLYVLVVPRSASEPGRYESCRAYDEQEVIAFLEAYKEFLEQDGRHHFWIGSTEGSGRIVYDRHQMLFLYGNLNAFEQTLTRAGYQPARLPQLGEHVHLYHAEFDDFERQIVESGDFRWTPLLAADEA